MPAAREAGYFWGRNIKEGMMMRISRKRFFETFMVLLSGVLLWALIIMISNCDLHESEEGDGENPQSSRAYKGHEGDVDMNNFVNVYPDTIGTRLDDCQTCHTGGWVYDTYNAEDIFKNPCDYCHLYVHPDPDLTGVPASYQDTLNPYGLDYKVHGRDKDSLEAINFFDSDEDYFVNVVEINDLRYPGDASSKPGQPIIPLLVLSMEDLQAMAYHAHLQLNNAKRHETDDYAYYEGVTIKELLQAIGVDMGAITGISVIAPDGFVKDFTIDQINNQYPDGLYKAGLYEGGVLAAGCGFVNYPPATYTAGLTDGAPLPDQWLTLGYRRDGGAIDSAYLDPTTGSIEGEGPYRIIVPQDLGSPPDRGSKFSPSPCQVDGYDYNSSYDHNAGTMVRGVIAIRVNPMPEGYEEFDYMNGGWAYIDTKEVIIYGQGVNP
jgi:hypothetical protein